MVSATTQEGKSLGMIRLNPHRCQGAGGGSESEKGAGLPSITQRWCQAKAPAAQVSPAAISGLSVPSPELTSPAPK